MKQQGKHRTRWLRRGVLGLAALAVAVPASPALGAIPSEPAQLAPVSSGLPTGVTEPLREQPTARGPVDGLGRSLDPTTHRRPAVTPPAAVTVTRVPAGESGFDWSDAGVGIGIGIAASLTAGTVFLATRGVRRRPDHLARA